MEPAATRGEGARKGTGARIPPAIALPRPRSFPLPLDGRRGAPPPPSPQEVAALVTRAAEGDRDAFGQLYCHYYRPIYNLARFYLARQAEDVVAETFIRAWGAIGRYRDIGRPFVAWLYGIARHVVADELRAARRVEPRDRLPDLPSDSEHDDRLMLASGLGRLPPMQRRVIELRYLVGLSHKEIATVLGKTEGAVKAQRWRALRNLALFFSRS